VGILAAVLHELLSTKVTRDRLVARRNLPLYALISLRGDRQPVLSGNLSVDTRPVAERLRRQR
jgi:hypothetical protein